MANKKLNNTKVDPPHQRHNIRWFPCTGCCTR